jgi:hypothetical protein
MARRERLSRPAEELVLGSLQELREESRDRIEVFPSRD